MSDRPRTDKFTYTHPSQIVTGAEARAEALRKRAVQRTVSDLVREHDLDPDKVAALLLRHLDDLRAGGGPPRGLFTESRRGSG